jgi:uncharacterized membrane protein YqhA
MFEHLLKVRYLAVVIVILAVLHALAFLVMGTQIALRTYWHLLHESLAAEGAAARPGLELLHSLDFLFVAIVFVILALGIAKLFLLDPEAVERARLPTWLKIDDSGELKVLLWETILTTLLIAGLSHLVAGLVGKVDWSVLVIPAAILILSMSLYFMKKV